MVVLEGTPTMTTPDTTDWLRREKVAEMLACSLPAITRLQDKRKLKPVVVDGINFYNPTEVAVLAEERARERDQLLTSEGRKQVTEAYMLDTTRAIIALIRDPREKIDDIQFKIIERQASRIVELETKLDAAREAVELAKDATLERNLAVEQVKSESRIKEMATGRVVATLGKLVEGMMGGKGGVTFTPEQLEELLIAHKEEPFLTDEQTKQATQIVAQHKAKTNGKAVVESVAKSVVQTTGAEAK